MATDDKVSVILTSTNSSGTVKQKSFTYISPEATNGQLKTFAQAANALTKNTYNGSKKVTQVDLDTADPGGGKQTPTLSLEQSSCSVSDISAKIGMGDVWTTVITTDSDGAFYVKLDSSIMYTNAAYVSVYQAAGQTTRFGIRAIQGALPGAQTIIIGQAETDNFKAAEVTFTITA